MNVLLPHERRKMPGISRFYQFHGKSETPQSQKHQSRVADAFLLKWNQNDTSPTRYEL